MNKMEIRSLSFREEKASSDGNELNVQGYIETGSESHTLGKPGKRQWREVIAPGVFKEALAKNQIMGKAVDFILNHDTSKILATTKNSSLLLEEDEIGLYIDATISPTSWGKDTFVLIKDNIIDGLSFGMNVIKEEWSFKDGLPLRTILGIELFEISALRVPAYPSTLLEARGLEVKEVEIPNDIEKRSMEGGNSMNNQDEVTPKMIYDGLTLIANKLDNIIDKIDLVDRNRAIEGVNEAKEVLAKVETITKDLAASQNVPTEEVAVEEPIEKREDETVEEAEEQPMEQKAKDPEKETEVEDAEETEETEVEEKVDSEETKEEIGEGEEELKPEDVEKEPVITEDEQKVDKSEEKTPEENDSEKKQNKDKIKEFRSLLNTLNTEVPEIE